MPPDTTSVLHYLFILQIAEKSCRAQGLLVQTPVAGADPKQRNKSFLLYLDVILIHTQRIMSAFITMNPHPK